MDSSKTAPRTTKGAWEVEAFGPWRHVVRWGPGVRAYIKRQANRRERRDARQGRGCPLTATSTRMSAYGDIASRPQAVSLSVSYSDDGDRGRL